ncbi:MAG: hypothetical protein SGARI_000303 [Bacillariaceae sp.]
MPGEPEGMNGTSTDGVMPEPEAMNGTSTDNNSSNNNDAVLIGSETANISTTSPMDFFPQVVDEEERSTYLQWYETGAAETYPRHTFLPTVVDQENGAAVFWKLYSESDTTTDLDTAVGRATGNDAYTHVQFAVAVRATGWVGFGISAAGGMLGSDIALFETQDPTTVRDTYVLESFAPPLTDDCQSWTLLDVQQENGWLIVEMSRPLDTKDQQDHVVVDDSSIEFAPTRLIAAWGETPSVSYHGFNVGKMSTKLFPKETEEQQTEVEVEIEVVPAATFEKIMEEQADGYFEITSSNYTIPATETTYHYVCKSFDELKEEFNIPTDEDGTITVIGGGAVLSPETVQYVHHFIVYGNDGSSWFGDDCGPTPNMLAGWAPGEEPQAMPDNVGIKVGPGTPFSGIVIEIHYNNPAEVENQVDSSGWRIFYTTEPREIEAAFMLLGDPGVQLWGEPIAPGLTEYSFSCANDCTNSVLDEPVTVIAESLHMHKTGVRMTNELIRDGEVVNLGSIDVFDFDQQGSFKVQQNEYVIEAGDSFKTTCFYRAPDGTATTFGEGSQQEMCMAFLLYYPAKKISFGSFGAFPWSCYYGIEQLPVCKEQLEFRSLTSDADLARAFGTPSTECTKMDGDKEDEDEETGDGEGASEDTGDEAGTPTSANELDEDSAAFSRAGFVSVGILLVASLLVCTF